MLHPKIQDDAALVHLARERPEEAPRLFRLLYERHSAGVFSFLLRLLSDRSLAEDILQEAFLRAYRDLDHQRPSCSFRAWVHRIARNAAIDHLRSMEKRRRFLDQSAAAPIDEPVVDEVGRRERVGEARDALADLPVEDRALLMQRHGQGMKIKELAEVLACTERTVINRLNRAAARLTEAVLARRRTS